VPYHFQEEVWNVMVATGKELARRAEAQDATVLFEPFFRGFLASAKRTRLFLEAVDSPRIRALLDPANLLEVNDLEEMFEQLQPWIECLHAKDRKLHVDRGVPAGQGDLDYDRFVRLAAARTLHAPLILEYVGPQDYQQAHAHLREAIRRAGDSVAG
jgi:sugar phosphate isomerase/epimerase